MSAPLYGSRPQLVGHLADCIREGRLALILGAGVSVLSGAPNWATFAQRVVGAAERPTKGAAGGTPRGPKRVRKETGSPPDEIERIRRSPRYAQDPEAFRELMRRAIYQDVPRTAAEICRNPVLDAVAAVSIAMAYRASPASVVTLNYDDLFETVVRTRGVPAHSLVGSPPHWVPKAGVHVVHPHGLVSRDVRLGHQTNSVVDAMDYSDLVADASDPMTQAVVTLMRSHVCLLVGLSGNDENLRRLFAACKQAHVVRRFEIDYWAVAVTGDDRGEWWTRRGVFPYRVTDFKTQLPTFLLDVAYRASQL